VELGITVTANPVTISPGDSSTISAYLVDTFGEPVPDGTTITFSTSEGTLTSNFAVTTDGIATVDLQLSRITTAIVTANYGAVSGSTSVTCTDGPIAIIENDTDDQISPIEITANSDCPYTITFNAYKSIPGTAPPLTYEWTMTHPDGDVEPLGTAVVTSPYTFEDCGIYVITLTVTDSCTVPCPHSDTATMRIIVTNPEGPTAIITSSEPITGSTINIIANSDCAYPVTFFGDKSTTTAICGDISGWRWTIVEPGTDGSSTVDAGTSMMMIYPFNTCGTYVVVLEVTDDCDRTASTFVTVIVSAPDGPTAVITSPLGSSPIKIEACSDRPYTVFFEGDDSTFSTECPGLTYAWSITGPDSPSAFDTPDAVTVSYEFDNCGDFTVTLMVTDSCSNTNSVSVLVEVREPVGPTAVITGSPSNITACSGCPYPVVFDGGDSTYSTDCPGLDYAWSITGPDSPSFDTFDAVTASFEFEDCGNYVISLEVTDGCGNIDSTSVTLEVTASAPPVAVINPSSPIIITACSASPTTVDFYANNSVNNALCGDLTYAWSISGTGSPSPFDTPDAVTVSYEFDTCGDYTVYLVVTDGCNNSNSTSVDVEVNLPTGPSVSITGSPGDITACSECAYSATFGSTVTVGETCGDVTYDWSISKPYGAADISSTTSSTLSYSFTVSGTYIITLEITDGCGNTDSDSVTVKVTTPLPPVAVISPSSTINITACSDCPTTVAFDADSSVNNACGDLDYAWSISGGPGSPTLTLLTGNTTSSTFSDWGTYIVTLVITDGCNNTHSDFVTVNVTEPADPTVSITGSPGNITACSACPYPVTFGSTVTGGAPCGSITYAWTMTKPATAATFSPGDVPTAPYSFVVCGTYVIDLTVTDGCGKTAHDSVTLEVSEPGAPTAAFTYAPITSAGHIDTGEVITFDASGSTSDSFCGIVTYDWDWNGDSISDLDTTDAITTHTFDTAETVTVILTVTDGCGKTNTKSEVIIVGS
jgi:hypothetical protein